VKILELTFFFLNFWQIWDDAASICVVSTQKVLSPTRGGREGEREREREGKREREGGREGER
jgi:hypothetical protein